MLNGIWCQLRAIAVKYWRVVTDRLLLAMNDFWLSFGSDGHDDVIKWKHFLRYWPFVRAIYRSPVNSPRKGQWRGALMFYLICTRTIVWQTIETPVIWDAIALIMMSLLNTALCLTTYICITPRCRGPWASYQIGKIGVCTCTGNAGNYSPATNFKANL